MSLSTADAGFRWTARVVALFVALVCLAGPNRVSAQAPSLKDVLERRSESSEGEESPAAVDEPVGVVDEFRRDTPRRSVSAYIGAARRGEWERAAKYLDLTRLMRGDPETDGPALARQLKIVLDRQLWVDLDRLSNEEPGIGPDGDGLDANRELVGRIRTADKSYDITLQRVRSEADLPIWKFSAATVAAIPELYDTFGYGPFGHYFPDFFNETDFLGTELRIWTLLILIPIACYLIAAAITRILLIALRSRHTAFWSQLARFGAGPTRLVLAVYLFSAIRRRSGMPLDLETYVEAVETVLLAATMAWLVMRVADVLWRVLNGRLIARGQRTAMALVPPARTTARIFIVFVAALTVMNSFGANVTAILAGLGVGGIAVALAAQKTFENLIGGITVFADRPVLVGDFCKVGDVLGHVEAIGLRSTRVRTLDRTLVTIPNAEFSNFNIENYAQRDMFRYHPTIGLRYETTPDQLRYILVEIRKLLYGHPKVHPDPARVRFTTFNAYSLDLEIFAYVVDVKDYSEFLEVAEDINLRIMDVVDEAGSSFAFPSQTAYIEQGSGLDGARAGEAERKVKRWRENKTMYLPGFPPEEVERLKDSLDYPPEGSPGGRIHKPADGADA